MTTTAITTQPPADAFERRIRIEGPDTDGRFTVCLDWIVVESPIQGRTSMGGLTRQLADRYASALRAGHGYTDPMLTTDVNGDVYVAATVGFMGRYLNADLRRIGY